MGVVYQATHLELNKKVALKTLHAEYVHNREAVARFVREGRSASQIRHPNVVDVTDVGVMGDSPYLVMELLEGRSLSRQLKSDGKLGVQDTLRLVIPVTHALSEAHREGIIHRDIKPGNIFLSATRDARIVPKVLDFGICRALNDPSNATLTASAAAIGTPAYMSPEQARGEPNLDARSDQYSLGAVIYQCLTGISPFATEGASALSVIHKITRGDFISPAEHRPAITPELEQVVLKMMALEPADRFETLAEAGRALLPFADEQVGSQWQPAFTTGRSSALGVLPEVTDDPPESIATLSSLGVQGTDSGIGLLNTTKLTITKADQQTVVDLRRKRWPAVALVAAAIGGLLLVFQTGRVTSDEVAPAPSNAAPAELSEAPVSARAEGDVAPPRVDSYDVSVRVEPADASIELDGQWVGTGRFSAKFIKGEQHRLRIQATGHVAHTTVFDGPPGPSAITLEPIAPTSRHALPKPPAATPADKPGSKPGSNKLKTDNIDPWATP